MKILINIPEETLSNIKIRNGIYDPELYNEMYRAIAHGTLQPVLTDKEQRIFLAAMGREEKVCEYVDELYSYREPYEDTLVSVCRSIERKVKMAL